MAGQGAIPTDDWLCCITLSEGEQTQASQNALTGHMKHHSVQIPCLLGLTIIFSSCAEVLYKVLLKGDLQQPLEVLWLAVCQVGFGAFQVERQGGLHGSRLSDGQPRHR